MRCNFRPWTVLSQLAAAGAILTCFAVVLNVGDFGKAAKRETALANTERTISPISVVRPVTLVVDGLTVQATDGSAPIRALIEPSSTPDLGGTTTPAAQVQATIVGVWAPDASACSLHNFREGLLPTIINMDGAWAGETFCIFKNQKQTKTGWKVVANCSNAQEQWTTHVRLTINGDRLIWTSKRGTQAYSRCAPAFLMAEVR